MAQNTYKKYKNNHTKRNIIIAALAVLLLGGGAAFAYYHSQPSHKSTTRPVNSTSYAKPNPQDSNASNNNKTGSNSTTLNNTPSTTSKGATSPATTQTSNLSVKIVSLINNGSLVHVGTIVGGSTSGNCTLTGTKGTQTVNLGSTPVVSSNNTTSCGVFNVPLSSFPSTGTWNLTVTLQNNGSSASDSGTVSI